jgi:hypothetical protein
MSITGGQIGFLNGNFLKWKQSGLLHIFFIDIIQLVQEKLWHTWVLYWRLRLFFIYT